jgi:hypothetical protein
VVGVSVCDPLAANTPLQAPEAVQPVVFDDVQLIVVELPTATDVAASDKVGGPGGNNAIAGCAWMKPKPEATLYPLAPPMGRALLRNAV